MKSRTGRKLDIRRAKSGVTFAERHQGCSRKVVFASERIASEHANYRASAIGRCLTVYRCKFCKGWHMTSQHTRG